MTTAATDDLQYAVDLAVDHLRAVADRDWRVPAAGLEWTCWETVEHIADDLLAYAGQLGPREPSRETPVNFGWKRRPGGPALAVFAGEGATTADLCQLLEATGTILRAVVLTVSPSVRSFHPSGASDPEGFAMMGVLEVLVHMADVAPALGIDWNPDEAVCARVLDRLFPGMPAGNPAWPTLLWATGRGTLPGHERRTDWQWEGRPRDERDD